MSLKLKQLDQQVIVICGASSGIGLATAKAAIKAGAMCVLCARSINALDEIVKDLNSQGPGQAISVVADVADRGQVERVAQQAINAFGRIDTWCNVAGVAIYGRLDQVSEEDNRRLFDTNFWGVVNGSLAALPYLKRQGGALINVGSEVSDAVVPMLGMYSASKHAVKGFTDALRVEIERVDKAPVSITLIQPTAVDTPFDEHGKNYMSVQPDLPRQGMIEPEKVADAILSAAVKPTRDVKVGMMAKLNTFTAKNAPAIAERMEAKQIPNLQRENQPPRTPDGALWIPSEDGRVHGDHTSA